uniref:Uncharacterized protein n=1 Tax=Timema cristinae TaxID=61476 RepID=A0A7R9DIM2_TIMCR|nr:unnamed protein product [Timema cristinae]
MASLVLTNSSPLRAKSFEKLPDQVMYPYAEPYDLQKHVCELSVSTKEATGLLYMHVGPYDRTVNMESLDEERFVMVC